MQWYQFWLLAAAVYDASGIAANTKPKVVGVASRVGVCLVCAAVSAAWRYL